VPGMASPVLNHAITCLEKYLSSIIQLLRRHGLYTTGICKGLEARRAVVSAELQHEILFIDSNKIMI
jgi:hypothetical protein